MTQLSPHFSLAEMTYSPTGEAMGIENIPSLEQIANGVRLCTELEKVRAITGEPLRSNSGFRCPVLNGAVGGAPHSRHMEFLAADFDPPAGWTHDAFQHAIADRAEIAFDLVLEEGTARPEHEGGHRWIHFQIARRGEVPRRLVKDAEVDRLGGIITRVARG